MASSRWSTPALILRIEITTALDSLPALSADRAQQRLKLFNIQSDVDSGRMMSAEAEDHLGRLLEEVRAATSSPDGEPFC
jgi:hypothetical protein